MLSTVAAALYGGTDIRSLSRVARPAVILSCLRLHSQEHQELSLPEIIEILYRENYSQEALLLSSGANVDSAQWLLDEGKLITIACDSYPRQLIANLGNKAPPIIWISDPSLRSIQPWNNNGSNRVCVSAVGCRAPLPIGLSIANEVGLWTASKSYLAVSGGAAGCDTAFGNAAFNAGNDVVHILPHGILNMSSDLQGFAISVCSPKESFSSARAMERNNLIYSFGHMTVVCSAKYRQGGSWLGAASALRSHRPVTVADWALNENHSHPSNYEQAQRALINLGANPMNLASNANVADSLDESLTRSLDRLAGEVNSGLFKPN
jgi:predicted Rossmann fold nucleotide-binding protein DprA/Smf involved in DNA uptake